jgi:ATP-dependent RNA helicase RhlE
VLLVEAAKKRDLLVELFNDSDLTRVIVFTRTKRGADRVARTLDEAGVNASAIHGNKSQGQRERALAAFRGGTTRALVATDIAARGIDIDGVSHVVNYELPEVAEAYVHRIGRTARAGNAGQAISLCDHEERDLLRAIERLTRLTLPKSDRRGAAGPRPAPVIRKAASTATTAPTTKGKHYGTRRDARSGRPTVNELRPSRHHGFRPGVARLGREVTDRRGSQRRPDQPQA